MRAWRGIGFLAAGCLVVVGACTVAGPGSTPKPDQLHREAQADLARWDAALAANAGGVGFVPVGGGTLMVGGDWGPNIDGNNAKMAMMSGLFQPVVPLPTDTPPDGRVQWQDGTTASVSVISARQALADMIADSEGSCPGCTPLLISSAKLTTATFQTSRGAAVAPAWEFSLVATDVKMDRVAVATRVIAPAAPTWDPNNQSTGISIDSAGIDSTGIVLTVRFAGAEGPGDKPCGADYTAEAVESENAVVVIVYEHANWFPAACDAVGYFRTAQVKLAKPLGGRAVLEVRDGQPIAVTAAN